MKYLTLLAIIAIIVYGLISPYRWILIFGFLMFMAWTAYRYILYKSEEAY